MRVKLLSRDSPLSLPPLVWLGALLIAGAAAALVATSGGGAEPGDQPAQTPRQYSIEELRQPVHWHSDFALFIRGQLFDFDQPAFISKEGAELDPWVHIHEPRSTVVHVHREQTTWDEFFTSIGFTLGDDSLTLPDGQVLRNSDTEKLKFYVNGVRIDTLMFQEILDLNQVLITFGPESDEQVLSSQWPAVTDEACIPSGLCRDRGIPEDETCGKGSGTCTG